MGANILPHTPLNHSQGTKKLFGDIHFQVANMICWNELFVYIYEELNGALVRSPISMSETLNASFLIKR